MTTSEELQKAFKYLFVDEVAALKKLARMLPANPVVVNIGAGAGTSGLAFMESRDDLRKYTIDKQRESSPFGCLEAEGNALMEAGLYSYDRNDAIKADSKTVGLNWPMYLRKSWHPHSYLVDLVFIDGDHSYEGAKGDIEAWLPNIKAGGILAVHDYHKDELYQNETDYRDDAPHPQDWPGVTKAVDELLVGKYEIILRIDSLVAFRIEAK